MRRALVIFAIVLALALIAIYASLPQWVPWLIARSLPADAQITELKFDYPTLHGVSIRSIVASYDRYRIETQGARIDWSLASLRAARAEELRITRLRVIVGPPRSDQPLPPLPKLEDLWQRNPFARVSVSTLALAITATGAESIGTAGLDSAAAHVKLVATAPTHFAGYTLDATVARAGEIALQLASTTQPSRVELVSHWPVDGRWSCQLKASLTADLLNAFLPAYGVTSQDALLTAAARGSGEWPPTPQNLHDISAEFALRWSGLVEGLITAAHIDLRGSAKQDVDGVLVTLAPLSPQRIELATKAPLVLLERAVPPALEISSNTPAALRWVTESAGDNTQSAFTLDSAFTIQAGDTMTHLTVKTGSASGHIDVAAFKVRDFTWPLSALVRIERPQAQIVLDASGNFDVDQEQWRLVVNTPRLAATKLKGYVIDHATLTAKAPIAVSSSIGKATNSGIEVDAFNFDIEAAPISLPAIQGQADVTHAAISPFSVRAGEPIRIPLTAQVRVTRTDKHVPLDLSGELALGSNVVSGTFHAQTKLPDLFANGSFHHDLATRSGDLSYSFAWKHTGPWMKSLADSWSEPFDIDAAEAQSQGTVTWQPPTRSRGEWRLGGRGNFAAKKVDAHFDDYVFSGVAAAGQWSLSANGLAITHGTASAQRFAIGTNVDGMNMNFSYRGGVVQLSGTQAKVLGGMVSASAITYDLSRGESAFEVDLKQLDLAQVLALEGEHVRGSGTLDGTLPVTMRAHRPTVTEGSIRARAPGGVIQYFDAPSLAGYAKQQGFEFALAALGDYHFTKLEAKVDYAPDHSMKLALRLEGNNPAVENGRAIHYNLNINENVADLLKSLRLANQVTEEIEHRVTH